MLLVKQLQSAHHLRLWFLFNLLSFLLFHPLRLNHWLLLHPSRPSFFFFVLLWLFTVVTPKGDLLLLTDPVTVHWELLLLESLWLHLPSECLKGLLDVLFLLTAHGSVWVSIELLLDFKVVFVKVGGRDCLARLGVLTVVTLRDTCRAAAEVRVPEWGGWDDYLIV
jgi:hypothetical protein